MNFYDCPVNTVLCREVYAPGANPPEQYRSHTNLWYFTTKHREELSYATLFLSNSTLSLVYTRFRGILPLVSISPSARPTAWIRSARNALLPNPRTVLSLATIRDLPLDPASVLQVARVSRLAELGGDSVREVSTDLLLSRSLVARELRSSLEKRCRMWVFSVDDELTLTELQQAFPGQVHALGPRMSNGRAAYGINVVELARFLVLDHPEGAHTLSGIDSACLPTDLAQGLEALGVPLKRRNWLSRLLRNPQFYVYTLVLVYSALRALPVTVVKGFAGSVAVLWGIDMVTALPYTWGVLAMVTATKRSTRFWGTVTTVVTFMAPYVYFWWYGHATPPFVWVVITAMILASIALEVSKFIQDKRLRRKYRAARALPAPCALHSGALTMLPTPTIGLPQPVADEAALQPAPLS